MAVERYGSDSAVGTAIAPRLAWWAHMVGCGWHPFQLQPRFAHCIATCEGGVARSGGVGYWLDNRGC
eukprot:99001-Chlamydomonas_euryale.AAC.1